MPCHSAPVITPLYFVETTSSRIRGAWFVECDRDKNSRKEVIRRIVTGELVPIKVLEVDEAEGTCLDVTVDILAEAQAEFTTWPIMSPSERLAAFADHARKLRAEA